MSVLWKKLTCSVLLVLFTKSNSKVSNARLKLSGGTNLGSKKKIRDMMTNQFITKFIEIPSGFRNQPANRYLVAFGNFCMPTLDGI